MSVPLAVFGPGILIATRTDITIPAAINVGFVQEFTIDTAATNKQLYGQKQYPLLAARGTVKATGKMKNATVSGYAMNTLFYGETGFSTGGSTNLIQWFVDSTYTSTSSTGTVVASSAGSTTFDADLGVKYANTGLPLQRVSTGSEVAGKYSVTLSGGVATYVFAAADQNLPLKVTFTAMSSAGQALVTTNKLIGTTPTFQLDYYTNVNQPTSKPFIVRIYNAIAEKQTLAFKLEDFMIPEYDFSLFANAADQVYDFVFPEVS